MKDIAVTALICLTFLAAISIGAWVKVEDSYANTVAHCTLAAEKAVREARP